ncbi:MAG: hypothetical protein A2X46_04365 [Lentisphaerae bacterium GWF2_57_35]|nr:MAG: hypothetical protein A2X46_04365 [Lentisphaerae bacterium GWF2_57_35]
MAGLQMLGDYALRQIVRVHLLCVGSVLELMFQVISCMVLRRRNLVSQSSLEIWLRMQQKFGIRFDILRTGRC